MSLKVGMWIPILIYKMGVVSLQGLPGQYTSPWHHVLGTAPGTLGTMPSLVFADYNLILPCLSLPSLISAFLPVLASSVST